MTAWWIQLSAYLLCSFLVYRRVMYLVYKGCNEHLNTEDWLMGSMFGILAAIFGPFSLAVLMIQKGFSSLKKSGRFNIPLWVFVAVPFERKVKEPESEYRYE